MFGEGDTYREIVRDLVKLEEIAARERYLFGLSSRQTDANLKRLRRHKREIDIHRAWSSTSMSRKLMAFMGFMQFPEEYL
jgi:hypothetical protein